MQKVVRIKAVTLFSKCPFSIFRIRGEEQKKNPGLFSKKKTYFLGNACKCPAFLFPVFQPSTSSSSSHHHYTIITIIITTTPSSSSSSKRKGGGGGGNKKGEGETFDPNSETTQFMHDGVNFASKFAQGSIKHSGKQKHFQLKKQLGTHPSTQHCGGGILYPPLGKRQPGQAAELKQ